MQKADVMRQDLDHLGSGSVHYVRAHSDLRLTSDTQKDFGHISHLLSDLDFESLAPVDVPSEWA